MQCNAWTSRGHHKSGLHSHRVVTNDRGLLAAVAVFAIAEGILVQTGVCIPPVNYQGTPFTDATVPMLLVAIVVGGSSLLAAATVFIRHAWSVFLAAAAGLIMIAWEVTELAVVQQFSWLQPIFIAIGLVVIALAAYLWTTEFRVHQLPTRHVSHA
jgi:hypothetical protein